MTQKKPLEPLIPLDQLKSVVAGLITVPKEILDKKLDKSEKKTANSKKRENA